MERKDEDMANGDFECKCPICGGEVKLVATTEDSAIHPSSVYGISKQVQGQLVHLAAKTSALEFVSFRYQNVYGPGQSLTNPYTGILSIFSTRIKNGNGLNIFEDGKGDSRLCLYRRCRCYYFGYGGSHGKWSCVQYWYRCGNKCIDRSKDPLREICLNVPISVNGNYRLGDIRHNYADITSARQILGFEPKWNFANGIEQFTNWVNQQEVQKDNYEASIEEMKKKGLYK